MLMSTTNSVVEASSQNTPPPLHTHTQNANFLNGRDRTAPGSSPRKPPNPIPPPRGAYCHCIQSLSFSLSPSSSLTGCLPGDVPRVATELSPGNSPRAVFCCSSVSGLLWLQTRRLLYTGKDCGPRGPCIPELTQGYPNNQNYATRYLCHSRLC